MADTIKTINLNILGRIYPLNVKEDNELVVVDAHKELCKLIENYKVTYAYKDERDLLAMSAIHFAIKTILFSRIHSSNTSNDEILEKLKAINDLLERMIS